MKTLEKNWQNGGSLSVTYEGSGDGSAVFSSDTNEGIDREMSVFFKGGGESIERKVTQEGLRQPFGLNGGGVFRVADGGRFGVLKHAKNYVELEYIESSGTQHIDTLYIPNTYTSIEMKASNLSDDSFAASPTGTWLCGARQGYLNRAFGFYYNQSSKQMYYAFGNKMPNVSYNRLYDGEKVIKADSTGLYIDNTLLVRMTSNAFTSPVTLSLFALNNNGSVISRTSYRLHYFKILEGDTIVMDLIPIVDKSGVACMYDKVSGEFFYNQGTGDFIVGYKNK